MRRSRLAEKGIVIRHLSPEEIKALLEEGRKLQAEVRKACDRMRPTRKDLDLMLD